MIRVQFSGRILPAALHVSIPNTPKVSFRDAEMTQLGLEFSATVHIEQSIVTINCDLNKFEKTQHLTPITMRAYDIAKAMIDLVSFSTGHGLLFVLETLTDDEGCITSVAPQQPELGALVKSVVGRAQFDQVLQIVLSDPPLFLALRDLIDAITLWHRAPTSCARAMEALRHSVAPGETDRKRQWEIFNEALRLEQSYLNRVMGHSTGPRHGDPAHIPGAVTRDVAKRAWIVMDRYLEFRKRGGHSPLPISDFPVLS
jgi:hypothetical protein